MFLQSCEINLEVATCSKSVVEFVPIVKALQLCSAYLAL